MSLYSLCVFSLVTFLMGFLWQSALAAVGYQCYICSWSPRDTNRVDNCTDENFDPRNVQSDTCEYGCETFVQWDPNEKLDQWRRNCLSKLSDMKGNCQSDKTVAWQRKRCTCASDYCNSATSGRISPVALLPMILVVALPLKRLL